MEKVNVEIHRVELDLEVDLRRMRLLAQLFDAQFSVAGVRFGVDSLIGLIPVAGDVVTTIIGTYPIFIARRHKLGKRVQARMATNLIIDFVGGSVPLAGDVFDVYFKSFLKNLALLEKAAEKKRAAR
jgi:hypothetical protein